jgi:glycosyltransferase involved in cell wall biosynthesis
VSPLITILIPSYERPAYLRRALDSISIQRFRDFEVIVTDDSASDSVEKFISASNYDFPIQYIRNHPPQGTPRNWTAGLAIASGAWIKILHDDDWFSTSDALGKYSNRISENVDLVFSGYYAVFEESGKRVDRTITEHRFQKIQQDPFLLCASNRIGPPSVMLFRRDLSVHFDPSLKWIVDWEGYIRMLLTHRAGYVSDPLICMSYNTTQVTKSCLGNPAIEVPEYLTFYAKHGARARRGVILYDAWWRLIRNLSIRSIGQLEAYASGKQMPDFLKRIVLHQRLLPLRFWRIGVLSKFGMFISYLMNR